jgi:hypothetical protein
VIEATPARSAVLLEVPEADAVFAEWRGRHDPAAARGVPGHITTLIPFLPLEQLDSPALDRLRALVADTGPLTFALEALDEFPGVLWLRPEPSGPLVDLTRRLWAAYPEYPPYDGQFDEITPHLTVAMTEDAREQDRLRAEFMQLYGPSLPIRCRATALSLFVSDDDGQWSRRALLPLHR